MKPKRILALVLGLSVLFSFAGCAHREPPPAVQPTPTPEPQPTSLSLSVPQPGDCLDPQLARDPVTQELLGLVSEGLTRLDSTGGVVPGLAQDWTVSPDGRTYTFHLREGLVWSNGDPLTASDFVFGWQRACVSKECTDSYLLDVIQGAADIRAGKTSPETLGVTAPDETTLEVQLAASCGYLPALVSLPVFHPINSSFFYTVEIAYGGANYALLSCGAFLPVSYAAGAESFSFQKNPNYYDAASVSLETIQYQVMADGQEAYSLYQQGELDLLRLTAGQAASIGEDPELALWPTGRLWYLGVNTKNTASPLTNQDFRLALTNALDREALTQGSGHSPAWAVVPGGTAVADGSDFASDPARFKKVCSFDASAAQKHYQKARSALSQSQFTLELIADPSQEAVAQAVKAQLEASLEGLTLELTLLPRALCLARMQIGACDLVLMDLAPTLPDPMGYLEPLRAHSALWSSGEYEALLNQSNSEADRWASLAKAEALLMEDAAVIPLCSENTAALVPASLTGLAGCPAAPWLNLARAARSPSA